MPVELHARRERAALAPLLGQRETGPHALVQVEAAAVEAEIEQLRARHGEHVAMRLPLPAASALLRLHVHLRVAVRIHLSGGRRRVRLLRPERALRVEQRQLAHVLVRRNHQPYVANRRVELKYIQTPLKAHARAVCRADLWSTSPV